MNLMSNLGTRIKELRTLLGLSQEELGNRIGVQRAAINKYEKGTVTNIPIENIERLAMVFDVSPTYLVGWNECNSNPLAFEAKVLQGVKTFYGSESVELLELFTELTPHYKKRALQYLAELSEINSKIH